MFFKGIDMRKLHCYSDCRYNQSNYRPTVGLGLTTCQRCLRNRMIRTTDPIIRASAEFVLGHVRKDNSNREIANMSKRLTRNNKKLSLTIP